ncbi:MAG TPA: hypothetical protein VLL75_11600, partial [Vicinamibacteria bacterium]|nr:hypothetical protein [Vicinamibacteria bacterium]
MRITPSLGLGTALFLVAGAASTWARESAPEEPAPAERRSLPERIERAAQRFSDGLERMGLYPHVTSLATGGGAAPGLAYFDPAAGPTRIGLYGALSRSTRGDSLYELRLGRIPYEPGRAPSRRPGFEWMPGFEVGEDGRDRFFFYGQAKLLDL